MLVTLMAFGSILAACGGEEAAPADTTTPTETATNETDATEAEPAEEGDKANGLIEASDMSMNPATATARTDTMVVGMTAPMGIFNPLFSSTVYDNYVNQVVFSGLEKVTADGTYENDLADSIEISDDQLTYTFHIRDDANFSDGTPVTANDYLFTMKVYHDSTYNGQSDPLSWKIVGGQEYYDGTSDTISGIKVVDDKTVEVTVSESNALTQPYLTTGAIIPESYYGSSYKQGDINGIQAMNAKPMGSGPYKLTKYTAGQEVVFEANEGYYGGAPTVPNLIYRVTTENTNLAMIQSGETDLDNITVSEDYVEELQALGFVDLNILPNLGYGYIGMNNESPLFSDKLVRQALTYGLNRAEVVEGIYGPYADVINIPQSNVSWAYTTEGIEPYEFDTEKAKELLDQAGWVVGSDGIREKDGKKFSINFSASAENPVIDALIPIMTENYKELGIELVTETLDFNAIMEKVDAEDYEMFFAAWGLTPDPDTNVYSTDGAQNNNNYSNPEVDKLMEQGLNELDTEKRKPIYAEVYKLLNEDMPAIFLYQRTNMDAINGRLNNWDISPYKDFSYSLNQVEIEQ